MDSSAQGRTHGQADGPQLLDYVERLVREVRAAFPPDKLPPVEMTTERDPKELEAVLRGPGRGGKSIYSLGYPP